ncbi:sigma-70 family RNA polymerase sigma factor [Brevibacillus sp. SYP-B805]|uniref:sigma-70 family RNA polymerase sigma factor n=1 Tax=Brevibacillus sp. SYP-B805 TaxID=1578199 RepID=UPI0013ED3270|nr:sigma-70 family RNA polymerase sigma factor [Brevibacillus sp. SYP-B805]NGQ95266.1 sigma-70 family RNA polymerase sigma factor [Brevibacillus sp. SYP-B805]
MDAAFVEDAERAVAGEKEAFVRLVMGMERTLYRVSRSILKSDSECVDAVQEAVLNAYHAVHTLREPRFFKTWMVQILMNVCYRMAREKTKVVLLPDPERRETERSLEAHVELREALDALEEDLRLAIELHYLEGFTVKEMAEILQVAEGTIKSRLAKARTKLASWFLSDDGERGWVIYER